MEERRGHGHLLFVFVSTYAVWRGGGVRFGVVLVAVPGTFPAGLEALGLDLSYLSLAPVVFIRAHHTPSASCCRRKLF